MARLRHCTVNTESMHMEAVKATRRVTLAQDGWASDHHLVLVTDEATGAGIFIDNVTPVTDETLSEFLEFFQTQ